MEKGTPHCKLKLVHCLVEAGQVRATVSAAQGAAAMGLDGLQAMCEVVLTLSPSNFFKSMTTHADHRVWQDVYRAQVAGGFDAYIKLTVIDDVLIVSFKEL